MRLIVLFGKAGVGKDTTYETLKQVNEDAIRFAFADEVKRIATDDFGWDGKKDNKGRRLLQVLGTEAGREYNKNIWVDRGLKILKDMESKGVDLVVCTDVRFKNEMDLLKKNFKDVTVCKIERRDPEPTLSLRDRQRLQARRDSGVEDCQPQAVEEEQPFEPVTRLTGTRTRDDMPDAVDYPLNHDWEPIDTPSQEQGLNRRDTLNAISDIVGIRIGSYPLLAPVYPGTVELTAQAKQHPSENDLNDYEDYDHLFINYSGKIVSYKEFVRDWYKGYNKQHG